MSKFEIIAYILVPLISPLLAVYLFIQRNENQKRDDEKKKKNQSLDKIRYFSIMIIEIIKLSEQLIENLTETKKKYEVNKFSFHPSKWVSTESFKRIGEKLNLDELLNSYIDVYTNVSFKKHRFNEARYNKIYSITSLFHIKQFQRIIGAVDYLNTFFEHEYEAIKKKNIDYNNFYIKASELFGKCENERYQLFVAIEKDTFRELQKQNLHKIFYDFSNIKNGNINLYSLKEIESFYLNPFIEEINRYINPKLPLLMEIPNFLQTLNHLKITIDNFNNSSEGYIQTIEEGLITTTAILNELKSNSERLREITPKQL